MSSVSPRPYPSIPDLSWRVLTLINLFRLLVPLLLLILFLTIKPSPVGGMRPAIFIGAATAYFLFGLGSIPSIKNRRPDIDIQTIVGACIDILVITLMTFAIFTRSNMVVNPGWWMVADTLLVLVSTVGIAFAMFGRTSQNRGIDILLRLCVAAACFVVMFHPDMQASAIVAALVILSLSVGFYRHHQLAPRTYAASGADGDAASVADLAPVLAEAKRDIG